MIDGHIHVGKWSDRFRGLETDLGRVDAVLEECGIGGAIITATDLRENERVLEEMERARLRYWFFPWVDPNDEGGIDALETWGDRVSGLKFHPSCDRVRITDPRCEPFLEYARAKGLPVLVHCGRWQEMASYRFALDAAAAHPGVRFVFAHMGGDQPDLVISTYEALERTRPGNVWLGMEGIREYWLIRRAIEALGADRFIFGSDFPIGHPRMYLGVVEALGLTENEASWVCEKTALSLVSGGVETA